MATIGMEMVELLVQKKINSMVNEVIKFEDIPQGLKKLISRHVQGKIVAIIQSE